MRIAVLAQPIDSVLPPEQNSIGLCAWATAHALAKSGHEVTLYGPGSGTVDSAVRCRLIERSDSWVDRQLDRVHHRLDGAHMHQVRRRPRSTTTLLCPSFRRKVVREVRASRPDLVVVEHHTQYLPALRRSLPNQKLMVVLNQALFSQVSHIQLERRLKAADVVGTASEYVAEQVGNRFPSIRDRCVMIGDGVDPGDAPATDWTDDLADDSAADAADVFASGAPDDDGADGDDPFEHGSRPQRVIYFGAVTPHKGVHVLAEAVAPLLETNAKLLVDVYGSTYPYPLGEMVDAHDRATVVSLQGWYGDYPRRLHASIPESARDRFRLHGSYPRASLGDLLRGATVAVFPTVAIEAFGMPAIEAMAAGVPVVATSSGGMSETISDGETGLLVPRNDPIALRRAIGRVLDDSPLRHRLAAAGRAAVLERWTWDHVAQRILESYDSAGGADGARRPGRAGDRSAARPGSTGQPADHV